MPASSDANPTPTAAPTLNPMSLSGRAVIITGAGQGIGRAVAELVCGLGGAVGLVDMNADALAETQAGLPEGRSLRLIGSVAEPGFADAAVAETVARFGALHGLVNNAGITRPAMISKMTEDQWREVIDVHLTGAWRFIQAAGAHMIARHKAGDESGGAIVNISSDAGVQGTIGQINYSVAKSGILGATMSMAREWARYNIRANAVAFGMVETPMTETVRSEKFRDTYLARVPMGRWSSPQEAANPICFLLSDAASYITGQRISANGGSQMNP
ncbi:3-oxoacyl-[acyl-carrier protein] reductase [Albimonas donghaensis]|uniref:3-oxoacyl-[acyl-carrier protein] reductase n=1 Tax=Albimonas donghaensis TaxID=356660 RepID=A0A1H3FE59_9RHOB|nr:SDR family NAD(P)-dependent oxidoreductase [Albimonas donghaensis]SDX89210.1 3-oxoacyl-[acyl-carrier protein] reductase [Albimonas donghaensis]